MLKGDFGMKKLQLQSVSSLPKPIRWGVYAIGAYLAYKVAVLVLMMLAVTLSLIFTGVAALVIVALIVAMLKR